MVPTELRQSLIELLQQHVLFSLLDDPTIHELINSIQIVTCSLGETIIQEGEQGDCAYLIYSGRVRIVKETEEGRTTLGTLGAGDLFGEVAILRNVVRTATVRVSEDATLFRIDQADFRRLLAENPALADSLESLNQQRELMDFLRLETVFSVVPPRSLVPMLSLFQEASFAEGEKIIESGTIPNRLYLLREGEVRLSSETSVQGFLQSGSTLAENELLHHQEASADYVATCPTHCHYLNLEQVHQLLRDVPDLRDRLLKQEVSNSAEPVGLQNEKDFSQDEIPKPRVRWGRYPWVPQHDASDCGAAALAMIAHYYGAKLYVGQLREKVRVDREGSTMLNLAIGAEHVGFQTQAVRTDLTNLASMTLPGIALWQGYHYVVIFEANAKRVVIGDPAIGILKMKPEELEKNWSGQLLLLSPTTQLKEQEHARTGIAHFLPFLSPVKKLLIEILLASLLLELLRLASPIFTQLIVDKVLVHQNVSMLNLLLFGMLILGAFQIGARVVRQYLLQHVGQRLGLAMTADLFRQLLRLPMRFFHSRKLGDFLTRFEDSERIKEMLTGRVITTLLDVLMIVTSLSLMLYYNVKLTLVALAAFPFYIGLTLLFTPWLKRNNRLLFEKKAAAESALVESLREISSIKDANAEIASRWKFENHVVRESQVDYRGRRLSMWLDGFFRSVNILSSTFLLWFGAHLVIQNELTVGQLMAFNALVAMMAVPVLGLVQLWFELQNISVALERLADVYDAEPEQDCARAAIPLSQVKGRIQFENVSFRYNSEDRNILRNITLTIEPGETIALVGRSGAGKTTLAMLLQRFYLPTEGRISLDGTDLASVDLTSLRGQLGVVAQETSIFNGTIRENIALSNPDLPLEHIIDVAQQADVHEMVMGFPLAYDTVIGELGVRLSGGQRQRLAIARALLKNPKILILDEATSALDYESERAVQQNLQKIMKGRTTLIIAHRLSTVQNADRIIVLDAGRIVEEGTHSELRAKRGLYYYLTSQQVGE